VDQPANPEPDGATLGTGARTRGLPRMAPTHFRDLILTGAGRGWNGPHKVSSYYSCTYLGGQGRWSPWPRHGWPKGLTVDANTSSNHYARHGAPH
jgi:hypothetical protein